jgi:hypothetical protein
VREDWAHSRAAGLASLGPADPKNQRATPVEILLVATHIADFVPLGYIGVDIVLDATHGPMVLELNARPGLAIQLANDAGLELRLQCIDDRTSRTSSPETRVRQACDWFGAAQVSVRASGCAENAGI